MVETQDEIEFWKAPENKKGDAPTTTELGDEEMVGMKIRTPKPIFKSATKCKIVDVKFFKVDAVEKNKNNEDTYVPFVVTLTLNETATGKEFKETYRGGRFYDKDGKTSTYIGPASALGRLKASCIERKLDIGQSLVSWAKAMTGMECIMQAEAVTFAGKRYEKNYIVSFL